MSALVTVLLLAAAPAGKIAVLDLESTGVPDTLVATLSLLLPNAVRDARPGAEVMSGAEIRSLIGFERQRTLLGCKENSSCIAEMGGALGATELVAGSLGKVGKTYVLQLRRIDVEKGRILASNVDTVDAGEDALLAAVRNGVRRLFAGDKAARLTPAEPPAAMTSLGTQADRRRWPGYAMAAGGGLGVVVGLVTAGITSQRYSDLASQQKSLSAADYRSYYDQHAPGIRSGAAIADWTTVGGALVAAAGVVWILRTPAAEPVAVSVGPGALGVAGRF